MPCAIADREIEITPSRKRKRESSKTETTPKDAVSCFTNAAFSSTPKKVFGKRRGLPTKNENSNPFLQNNCMEVKSIVDILHEEQLDANTNELRINPFEVLRNPAKKKKRKCYIEEACFENPALNLEVAEKQFNPFEVVRAPFAEKIGKCFVNEALNIRGQDGTSMRNPFEVLRKIDGSAASSNCNVIANLCMEEKLPTNIKICLPFTPTLGCRIDFKNMSLSQLTRSELFSDKLIISPVPVSKRSLGTLNEEESSLSIGKELDRYQLELENSINEAKLHKNIYAQNSPEKLEKIVKVEIDHKITFTHQLEEIVEADECEEDIESIKTIAAVKNTKNIDTFVSEIQVKDITSYEEYIKIENVSSTCSDKIDNGEIEQNEGSKRTNDDCVYESESDEDIDFKAPAPFIRAYRTEVPNKNDKSLSFTNSNNSNDEQKTKSVKNTIRKSIRKLVNPYGNKMHKNNCENLEDKNHDEKNTNFLDHLRQSLRRKPNKPLIDKSKSEISIIDTSERTMKFKSNIPQTEYYKIEDLTNEKKHTLRYSLRKSTRDIMNTVFHKKHEGYALTKQY